MSKDAAGHLRIFVLPSWCPTAAKPLSGTFFIEQTRALAAARPHWQVAFCSFDLDAARIPWRPGGWRAFVQAWRTTPRLSSQTDPSGMLQYHVWSPFWPKFGRESKWRRNATALTRQAGRALDAFTRRFGPPDLIHARAIYPGGVAAVELGRRFDVPVVITEHLGPFPPPQLCVGGNRLMPFILEAYAGATALSADGSVLARRMSTLALAAEVCTLPNFLPDEFGASAKRREPQSGFHFLSTGWPSREKGTDILLRAFARLDPPVRLTVIGASPQIGQFQTLAMELGVSDRVRWLGAVAREQLPAQLSACDAFVLPSQGENFGVAYIEALAFGKPLIATRCGGPEDIVRPSNGLLVPIGDVEALAAAMGQIMRTIAQYDPAVLRRDFLERFSASSVIRQTEVWYRDAIKRYRAGR